MRGLGQLDPGTFDPSLDVAEGGSYVPPPPADQQFGSFFGSSSGPSAGNVFANLLSQWTTIGGRVLAPTTSYTRGPGGTLQITTPAGSTTGAALLSGAVAPQTSSLLLIGGLALGGLLLVMMLKK